MVYLITFDDGAWLKAKLSVDINEAMFEAFEMFGGNFSMTAA